MLKDIVGSFVQREDIPANAGIRNLQYGMNPLYVIDTLYKANLKSLCGFSIDLETEMPWKTMDEALANFSMFNIVDDVENAAQKIGPTRCKSFADREDNIEDIEKYINRVSNIYFKFNEYQRDCFSVIEDVKGELLLFAAQLNIKIDPKRLSDFQCASDTLYSLRSPEILIAPASTEIKQLRRIKHLFEMIYWLIKTIICALCEQVPPIEKPEEPEIDL